MAFIVTSTPLLHSSFISTLTTHSSPRTISTNVNGRPACSLDPSRPIEPSQQLSSTDRSYLRKVKAKLHHAQRARTADVWDESDGSVPVIPDDLDVMEDMIYNRGPSQVGQAKLFGGWLDESLAGRKANTSNTNADTSFKRALKLFGRGSYAEAATLFHAAAQHGSNLSGQYALWEAQALDAAGRKRDAVALFTALCTHSDAEVRKVARELLFIVTAPRLPLNDSAFLPVPDIDDVLSPSLASSLGDMSSMATFRTMPVEKPPEPHSLEWYMERQPPVQSTPDNSLGQVLVVTLATLATLAFMAASP